jgi:undecaprenyl-diphosphatase
MIEWLISLDTRLFLFFNGLHTPFLDLLMYDVSRMWIWVPLYLGVIAFIIRKWKMESIWIILSIIICVVLTDQLTNLTKEFFGRLRPSHEPALQGMVHHVRGYMGGQFGFVSGHSSNVFGFALLSSLILKQKIFTPIIFFWAAIVAYSRIYLGVHYPLDILGGMILGMGIALIVYTILRGFQKKLIAEIKSRFF